MPYRRNRYVAPERTALIVPRPSNGALLVARTLQYNSRVISNHRFPVVRHNYNRFINWGCSRIPDESVLGDALLNSPSAVGRCVNKRTFFQHIGTMTGVDWYTSKEDAIRAMIDRRVKMVCRTSLTGSSGAGIVIARDASEVVDAKLYTVYVPKHLEYRLHVFDGEVVAVQQKRRRNGYEQGSRDEALIRNAGNGWVYAVDNVDPVPSLAITRAVRCVGAAGLDFGAVDIIIGRDDGVPRVLEINTAPGIESPTVLAAYRNAIRRHFN